MNPISLSGQPAEVPEDYSQLLEFLGSRPQPALVYYGPDDSRIELSGRVLTNWAIKLIGLFTEEGELGEGDEVLLDTGVHWKAAATALAAAAMGAIIKLEADSQPQLVVTDQPGSWTDSARLGEAELAALTAGMLDTSFEEATGEPIPAWVLDIAAEVRQQPDQLISPLPSVPLPESSSRDAASTLVLTGWGQDSAAQMADAWANGGSVVLFAGEPSGPRWDQMRVNEGLA